MFFVVSDLKKVNLEISLINILILCFLFRTAIPAVKYPFIIFYSIYVVFFFIRLIRSNQIIESVSDFFRNYLIVIALFAILIISFLLTYKIYLIIFTDIVNAIIVFSFIFILNTLIKTKSYFEHYLDNFYKQIILFSILVSAILLTRFFNDDYSSELQLQNFFLYDESKNVDYNFATIPVFFGIICTVFWTNNFKSLFQKVILNFLLILFSLSIIFSGSRRGLFLYILLLISFIILQIISYKTNNQFIINVAKSSRYFIIVNFILFLFLYIFFFLFSYESKNAILKSVGFNNIYQIRTKITHVALRYATGVNNNDSYQSIYNTLWRPEFDPLNPNSGWGTKNSETVYPLTGRNVEIVPSGAKGYLMNSSCNAGSWKNDAYSYTSFGDSVTIGNEFFNASVYCYVSEDFDGDRVWLDFNQNAFANALADYDLQKKGTWQKLNKAIITKFPGTAQARMSFRKNGVTDFLNMKGYVIFAYPEYRKLMFDPNNPASWGTRKHTVVENLKGDNSTILPDNARGYMLDSTSNSSSWGGDAYSYTRLAFKGFNSDGQISASVFCFVSKESNVDWVRLVFQDVNTKESFYKDYDLLQKDKWQKIDLNGIAFRKNDSIAVYLYHCFKNHTDFSLLKGKIIFSNPNIKISEKSSEDLSLNFDPYNSKNPSTVCKDAFNLNHTKYQSINTFIISLLNKFLTRQSDTKSNLIFSASMVNTSIINLPGFPSDSIYDKDLFKNMVKKIISEDTVYMSYSSNISEEITDNVFIASRKDRWNIAKQIYLKEHNIFQKIFGGGFKYLNYYGDIFYNDKNKSDWPHNPFLSILLYSGILGLLFYIFILIKIIIVFVNRISEYYLIFCFFTITFFFSFFSANSPFDPPVSAFFMLLPFLIMKISAGNKNKDTSGINLES